MPRQLTASRSPEAGGGVASLPDGVNLDCNAEDSIRCGACNANYCTKSFNANSNVVLKGFPGTGYAFYQWTWNNGANTATDNPHTFTMSGALGVTAVFKRTFRCASGDFYEPYDSQDPEIYGDGECVTYVRHETGADIYGNANTWYQGAINAGYHTTAGPSIPTGKDMSSAIIVFGIVSESSFPTGHVGIVINKVDSTHLNIRDANWNLDGKLDEHVIDVTNENYNILGYIYCMP
ncbi:MAG: CHAP domain-containing protein [Parcubacteria group bacterium]